MWKKIKYLPLKTSLVFIIALSVLNGVYYQNTRNILIHNQETNMTLLINNISEQLNQNAQGEEFVEGLIATNLRTAAIAAQHKLNPDIDHVSNEELVNLKHLLGVDEITLFKKTSDDIIGAKSSDPKEINISSKAWDAYYVAFNQLFDRQKVNVGIGQTLQDYWSGPVDRSSSIHDNSDKWGYYYDGTTNYIIDPFVHDAQIQTYRSMMGIENTINRVLENNKNVALEISVLNTSTLLERKLPKFNENSETPYADSLEMRLVSFGSYEYRDPAEKKYAEQALKSDSTVFYITTSNGKKVIKSFSPVHTNYLKFNKVQDWPIVEVASDYTEIQNTLHQQLNKTLFFMGVSTVTAILILIAISILFTRNKKRAVQDVQEVYVGNIDSLFQAIREQRHDFNNHLQTIQSFLYLKKYDDLHKYCTTLIGDITAVNELITAHDPSIIAILQAKIAQSDNYGIQFAYEFKNMAEFSSAAVKSTDLVKIVSNLIDNAFDATMELSSEQRYVKVGGYVISNQLCFKVTNTGKPIPEELKHKIFEKGYTSKQNGKHSGLGLGIVKEIVRKYKGTIDVESHSDGTTFTIHIPFLKE